MKLYCSECFAKNDYKFSKPKFCAECGAKIGDISSFNKKNKYQKENDDLNKIRNLEAEIEKLKHAVSKENSVKKFIVESSDEDENYDDQEFVEQEDYQTVQAHINNFKKNKDKFSGVIVENDNKNSGISFGKLIESASNSQSNSVEEFKMTCSKDSDEFRLSKEEILDQLRVEASSMAKVIEIN